jgi:hypothetical protein
MKLRTLGIPSNFPSRFLSRLFDAAEHIMVTCRLQPFDQITVFLNSWQQAVLNVRNELLKKITIYERQINEIFNYNISGLCDGVVGARRRYMLGDVFD